MNWPKRKTTIALQISHEVEGTRATAGAMARRIADGLNLLEGGISDRLRPSDRLRAAIAAMQGLLADSDSSGNPEVVAEQAVLCTDALLRRLAQE